MSHAIDCWNTIGVRGTATCERLATVAHCRNCPDYVAAGRTLFDREIPDGSREEWARAAAQPEQTKPRGSLSVIVFRIGTEWLALKTVLFQRAVQPRPVHSVPLRSNRIFQGIVNVDGELLLCFSAAAALGLEPGGADAQDRKAHERLLVVSREGRRFAFAVDEVLGVRWVAPEDLAPVPATLANAPDAVTESAFSIGAGKAGLLDEARFFDRVAGSVTL